MAEVAGTIASVVVGALFGFGLREWGQSAQRVRKEKGVYRRVRARLKVAYTLVHAIARSGEPLPADDTSRPKALLDDCRAGLVSELTYAEQMSDDLVFALVRTDIDLYALAWALEAKKGQVVAVQQRVDRRIANVLIGSFGDERFVQERQQNPGALLDQDEKSDL